MSCIVDGTFITMGEEEFLSVQRDKYVKIIELNCGMLSVSLPNGTCTSVDEFSYTQPSFTIK